MLPIVIIILIGISVGITIFLGTFFNLIFYLFKVIELITIVVLYFYLFSIYKEKLEAQGEERLKSFETLYNIPKVIPRKNEKLEANKVDYYEQELYSKPTTRKYQKSLLNTRKIKENEQIVSNFFKDNKEHYLDVDFNMQKLSLMTGIPSYYLSQTFNIALNTNFNAYLNKKRIEFACKLLENKEKQISVTELCFLCGYKSRTSFYDQFEKVTGHTLVEYKKISK
ncbi:helix-turn-helix transcriptional regulator [Dysgonomonas sp. Marseille-P4677]|nr:helix-turn-helix transcriptional regulator [Dysgonomonas sp. Marseille-P4677]